MTVLDFRIGDLSPLNCLPSPRSGIPRSGYRGSDLVVALPERLLLVAAVVGTAARTQAAAA
jgi:hypothetical protein